MKRLVLLGGGHVHVHLLKNIDRVKRDGLEVVIIQESKKHYYSGMGPGILSGRYEEDEISFDVASMARKKEVIYKEGRVDKILPDENKVVLEGGEEVSYDLLSCNLGSDTKKIGNISKKVDSDKLYLAKPIRELKNAREHIERLLVSKDKIEVGVIGGGPAGIEIAGNIKHLEKNHRDKEIKVRVYCREFLSGFSDRVKKIVEDNFEKRDIEIIKNLDDNSLNGDSIVVDEKRVDGYDILFMATGVEGSKVFKNSPKLKLSERKNLLTNDALQSVKHENIFGGGDCIDVEGYNLKKIGVHAVRESDILVENLRNYLDGREYMRYTPKEDYLMILNIGGGYGIYMKKNIVYKGRGAFLIKDYIDRKFIKKYK